MTDNQSIQLPQNLNGVHIHFVGIKGTGMAALVEILFRQGAYVTGSDVTETFYTDEILKKLGIKPLPFDKNNITADIKYIIYSSAYNPDIHEELVEAKKLNIPMMLYSEALGAVSRRCFSAGICGVHGKTTTTGITGTLFNKVDLPSQVLAGSIIKSFGDSCTMTSQSGKTEGVKYFAAETCEYRKNFMHFAPKKIILTSVESDHQDFYPTYQDILNAFVDYACLLPSGEDLIYCCDDKGAVEASEIIKKKRPDINLIPYGTTAEGDYKITLGRICQGKQYFSIALLGECAIKVPGVHNIRNSTAAVALTIAMLKNNGKDASLYFDRIKEGLLEFCGGKRRSEIVAELKTPCGENLTIIDDYGHHPTAVKTTLSGYRDFYRNHKIIVDFMSHTYTRTEALLEDFAQSFSSADEVIINKIYASAREDSSTSHVTGKILCDHVKKYHKNAVYAEEFTEACDKVYDMICHKSGKEDGYLFVTMGAGDNYKVGLELIKRLTKK